MSRFFMPFKLGFAAFSVFHTMSLEHRQVVGRVLAQGEGCPLDNILPVDCPDYLWGPLTRNKRTASESEAMSGQPASFEKKFLCIEKVLHTEWVAA